ncbi:MAG: DUF2946 domain-containing protein [Curvibacter sp.]|nr:MAG: DUF2946 domain-containing protein [Curvibacter sp.]
MAFLQTLREARSIVRWMLVWFVLSIGVAVAAPVVHPQGLTLICTTAGNVQWVADATTDPAEGLPSGMATHTLDCVMCLPSGAAPVPAFSPDLPAAVRSAGPLARPALLVAGIAEAPSARGPPALS